MAPSIVVTDRPIQAKPMTAARSAEARIVFRSGSVPILPLHLERIRADRGSASFLSRSHPSGPRRKASPPFRSPAALSPDIRVIVDYEDREVDDAAECQGLSLRHRGCDARAFGGRRSRAPPRAPSAARARSGEKSSRRTASSSRPRYPEAASAATSSSRRRRRAGAPAGARSVAAVRGEEPPAARSASEAATACARFRTGNPGRVGMARRPEARRTSSVVNPERSGPKARTRRPSRASRRAAAQLQAGGRPRALRPRSDERARRADAPSSASSHDEIRGAASRRSSARTRRPGRPRGRRLPAGREGGASLRTPCRPARPSRGFRGCEVWRGGRRRSRPHHLPKARASRPECTHGARENRRRAESRRDDPEGSCPRSPAASGRGGDAGAPGGDGPRRGEGSRHGSTGAEQPPPPPEESG